jgi:hypothetical protein
MHALQIGGGLLTVVGAAEESQSPQTTLILLLAGWFGLGLLGFLIGRKKNISVVGSVFAGLCGVLGLLVLLATPKREQSQERPTTGDAMRTGAGAAKEVARASYNATANAVLLLLFFLFIAVLGVLVGGWGLALFGVLTGDWVLVAIGLALTAVLFISHRLITGRWE